MDPRFIDYLSALRMGDLQSYENLAIVPLFISRNGGPDYALLKEALDETLITVTEVGPSGSVPELKVVNVSRRPVLLLDGEELMGAKQNRVLNTSILLKGDSETLIPVSCTEQGRWTYTSPTFADSDTILSQRGRATKTLSVTGSLHGGRSFASDQGRVWADVHDLHAAAGTTSRTLALRDVYTARTETLEVYSGAFESVPHQRGSLVFINGEPAGLDLVSREEAYAALHPKLVRSYAIDALVESRGGFDAPSLAKARAFLDEVRTCEASKFASVGLGDDYRFEGARAVGSALVVEGCIIHLAFFRLEKSQPGDTMSGYLRRRDFRRGQT